MLLLASSRLKTKDTRLTTGTFCMTKKYHKKSREISVERNL